MTRIESYCIPEKSCVAESKFPCSENDRLAVCRLWSDRLTPAVWLVGRPFCGRMRAFNSMMYVLFLKSVCHKQEKVDTSVCLHTCTTQTLLEDSWIPYYLIISFSVKIRARFDCNLVYVGR